MTHTQKHTPFPVIWQSTSQPTGVSETKLISRYTNINTFLIVGILFFCFFFKLVDLFTETACAEILAGLQASLGY